MTQQAFHARSKAGWTNRITPVCFDLVPPIPNRLGDQGFATIAPRKPPRLPLVVSFALLGWLGLAITCKALDAPRPLGPGTTNAPGPVLDNPFVTLRWEPVPGAAEYHVAIRDLKTGTLENHVVPAPTNTCELVLIAGQPYRWNLFSVSGAEESAVSETLYFQVGIVAAYPVITSVAPHPVPALAGPQTLVVNGLDFRRGCSVTLRATSSGECFTNRNILSRRLNQLVLEPNLTKREAPWTVEVINPGGFSSGEFTFPVVEPENLAWWRWRRSGWPWFVGLLLVALPACGWHCRVCRHARRAIPRAHEQGRQLGHESLSRDFHDSLNDLGQLNLLTGQLGVMAKNGSPPAEIAAVAGKISSATIAAVNVLEDMLWAGRHENDNLPNLVARLRENFGRFREANPELHCKLDFPLHVPDCRVPYAMNAHLLRITSEALRNILKHASATEVHCQLTLENAQLTLAISDNGTGFQPDAGQPVGHGLGNLRRRAEEMGGSFRLESAPGRGTKVIAQVPLPARESPATGDSQEAPRSVRM